MRALTEQSTLVAEAVAKAPAGKFDTGVTAGEWLARRIRGTRTTQFKVRERYNSRREHELTRLWIGRGDVQGWFQGNGRYSVVERERTVI